MATVVFIIDTMVQVSCTMASLGCTRFVPFVQFYVFPRASPLGIHKTAPNPSKPWYNYYLTLPRGNRTPGSRVATGCNSLDMQPRYCSSFQLTHMTREDHAQSSIAMSSQ